MLEFERFVGRALLRRLDAAHDVLHHVDALERIETRGRLARQHHGVGALAHGRRNVGDLGARGHGRADHRLEQVRGDDDGLALFQAQVHELRLHQRQRVVVDFDAQITARNHHRVGGLDDRVHVAHAALILDFGDDFRARTQAVQKVAQQQDVVALAHERQRHEVDARLDTGAHVALVLLGQRRQVHHHPRQVHVPA